MSFLTRVLDRRDQLDLFDREEEELEEHRGAQCSEVGCYSASSVFASSRRPV